MTKIELIEYQNGMYGVRRTRGLLWKKVDFFDIQSCNYWRSPGSSYFSDCFTAKITDAEKAFVLTGQAPGARSVANKVISMTELGEMNRLAQTDPGMKDLLEQAKEFYYLKRK